MTLTYVARKQTPLTFEQARDALETALGNAIGGPPTVRTLALALAHTALETGRWKSLYNYNWGNIKALKGYDGPYTCLGSLAKPVSEILDDGEEHWFTPEGEVTGPNGTRIGETYSVPPGHPQTRFRAYPDAAAGAARYVSLLSTNVRYALAWQELLKGNGSAFIDELARAVYFTANKTKYKDTVLSLEREYLAKLGGDTSPPPSSPLVASSAGFLFPLFF